MNPSRFHTLFEYLLDNLFDIATIFVAGYLVIRHQIQPFGPNDIADLLTGILAVLGLIAVSGLWDRNRRLGRIEKLSTETKELVLRRVAGQAKAEDFFLTESKVNAGSLASASTIDLAGMDLARTVRDYMAVLSRRLESKAHIRIIIVDPTKDDVLQDLVRRSNIGNTTAKFWLDSLEASQAIIDAIAKTPRANGRLELGYLSYAPAFGITLVDREEPHGVAQMQIYHHRSPEPKATFLLKKTDDPHWFGFFKSQYDILWDSCRVVQLFPPSPP